MLTHDQVWRGIDRLALRNELSPSGLAKRAGLDPTTFNKSKRITKEGKLRWPSTESIAKILEATQTSMADFVRLIDGNGETGEAITTAERMRFGRLGDLEDDSRTDASGFPTGSGWEEIDFPLIEDSNAYIVELDRDIAAPTHKSGDLIVVSPSSGIRRGDRILARLRDGEMLIGSLVRRTTQKVTISPVSHADDEIVIETRRVAWLARIIWLSQ
ncbi:MAG: helix-turn-helix transcriptional regulator [Geminicoccaceae bacterium]